MFDPDRRVAPQLHRQTLTENFYAALYGSEIICVISAIGLDRLQYLEDPLVTD